MSLPRRGIGCGRLRAPPRISTAPYYLVYFGEDETVSVVSATAVSEASSVLEPMILATLERREKLTKEG